MAEAPVEYTPEMTENLLNMLIRRRREAGGIERGRARSELMARGFSGGDSPYEKSELGIASEAEERDVSDITGDFYYRLAGLGREERLGKERRGYQIEDRDFAAMEAEKDRNFRTMMARVQREEESAQARKGRRAGLLGSVIGAGASLAGGLGGGYLASLRPGGGGGGGDLASGGFDPSKWLSQYRS